MSPLEDSERPVEGMDASAVRTWMSWDSWLRDEPQQQFGQFDAAIDNSITHPEVKRSALQSVRTKRTPGITRSVDEQTPLLVKNPTRKRVVPTETTPFFDLNPQRINNQYSNGTLARTARLTDRRPIQRGDIYVGDGPSGNEATAPEQPPSIPQMPEDTESDYGIGEWFNYVNDCLEYLCRCWKPRRRTGS
jgi:hypothetical protein